MKGVQLPVFNFSIKNESGSSVDIFIDGDIVDAGSQQFYKEYFGDDTMTSYKSFRDVLNKIDAQVYNVYINSGGGQVTEAMAIHDLLQDMQKNGKTVNTIGRGIIASAATYILMAGKKPVMSSNSWLMIHNVSGFCYGDVNEIENYAATMRKFNDAANAFYQNFTGLSKTVISNMMDSETWMTATDAQAKGFIKEVTSEATFSNSIKPENWLFNNTSVLNYYNSFTQKNNPIMETNKITEAIQNGFDKLLANLKLTNKKEDENVTVAFAEFSNSITEAITSNFNALSIPDNAAITTMVNDAVTNALKTVPTNFTEAITNATAGLATKDDVANTLNKEEFQTALSAEMTKLTNSIADKMGGKSDDEKGEETYKPRNNKPKTRFTGMYARYADN